MPKLEDILKAQGFTDADLQAAQTLLGDERFRGAVESYTSGLETKLGEFRTENDKWAEWAETTHKPQLESLQREKLDLVARTGSLEARLKALDPSYSGQPVPGAATPNPEQQQSQYLTREDFQRQVSEYAAAQGTAIAMANDLAMEYRRLTGSDMLDYQTTDSDGRPLSGMSALLYEARRDKKPLPDYIASKFDFAGKRAQAAAAQKQAAEEAIRKDERSRVLAEMGNPNTRPGMPSVNPFIPQRSQGEAGKMPWETSPAERRSARLARAFESNARSMVN